MSTEEKEIQNCNSRLAFECPRRWSELEITEDEDIRFCGICQEKVYLCTTDMELAKRSLLRHCVAV